MKISVSKLRVFVRDLCCLYLEFFDSKLYSLMDSLLSNEFNKVLLQYQLLGEARSCVDWILNQLELNEKDQIK